MRLTLGRDIGIVMAKGVLLGVVSTVTILPALIPYVPALHRAGIPTVPSSLSCAVPPWVSWCAGIFPSSQCSCSCFIPFSVAQAKTPVYSHYSTACRRTSRGIQGTSRLKEGLRHDDLHFIIVDDGLPARDMEAALTDEIEQVDGIRQVLQL